MKTKISAMIEQRVDDYRAAAGRLKAGRKANPSTSFPGERTYQMQMDRANGALETLYELDPTNLMWATTRWIC